jgi:predicted phage terminase large subunit-like protein
MLEKLLEKARNDFYIFCRLLAPDFYKKDRGYLKILCTKLNELYYKEGGGRLRIHMPPRHGKTRTIILFVSWLLGKNNNNKIITATYNETLSSRLGKDIRDMIMQRLVGSTSITYRDIFPTTEINPADSSKTLWSLKGKNFNFLATSPNGTATGIGANFIIIDDIIKNHEEALNSNHKEKLWEWYISTLQSRMEKNAKVIVVNTRWALDDLGGRLEESEKGLWDEVIFPVFDGKNMLCEEIKGLEELKMHEEKVKNNKTSWAIYRANYYQEPLSVSLSNEFASLPTYDFIDKNKIRNYIGYIDVANGGDYLSFVKCGIIDNKLFLLDVLYEQDSISNTIPKIIEKAGVDKIDIYVETNGAIGFLDMVQKQAPKNITFYGIRNTQNKIQRINNAMVVAGEYLVLPKEIWVKHPIFYDHLVTYNPKGKNKYDDAPDSIAGVIKIFQEKYKYDAYKGWVL